MFKVFAYVEERPEFASERVRKPWFAGFPL